MRYKHQVDALRVASVWIKQLPEGTVWSLTITNDDDPSSPSVFNIYAQSEQWPVIQTALDLKKPTDTGENFVSYQQGILLLSLIEGDPS